MSGAMASNEHRYEATLEWTGNLGSGTSSYTAYSRNHLFSQPGKPPIEGSSDPHFRGDAARWNPEELFVASLCACHMLWYLHLCAVARVVVVKYEDRAEGTMVTTPSGEGRFTRVVLRPRVWIAPGSNAEAARKLHDDAHHKCFIANSVNFEVSHEPEVFFDASTKDESLPSTSSG
jgi:organic hydroperoxide reductase OsmC/OhrA